MTTTTSRVARVHPQLVLPSCHRLSDTVSMCTSCAARALCAWRALGVVLVLFDVHAADSPASAGALGRLARSAERFRVASAVTPCRGCQRPR